EIRRLSAWATGNLRPDLTVLLDADPRIGLARAGDRAAADRLERESLEFHDRVRQAFRSLAEADPDRYLVIDATGDRDAIAARIRTAVGELLDSREGSEPVETVERDPAPGPV
ncbi:MAG TPA: dTMP kinase, partial [Mycobacteriales bacterium]|nr:dTMP kinase [Mycobacteriales bacterium]